MRVKRIDHVSFTVGDVDASASFYEQLGYRRTKRFVSAGPQVDEAAQIDHADMEIQWLEHPAGAPMLELIRYIKHPAERAAHNSKVGAAHLCLAVEDLLQAYAELSEAGVEFNSEPNTDDFGMRWVYSRDPDGNVLELVQDPAAT
jgi:catechol 2,3-dioxygenase-like lactoylglutathione lyase family enzyme